MTADINCTIRDYFVSNWKPLQLGYRAEWYIGHTLNYHALHFEIIPTHPVIDDVIERQQIKITM